MEYDLAMKKDDVLMHTVSGWASEALCAVLEARHKLLCAVCFLLHGVYRKQLQSYQGIGGGGRNGE